MTSSGNVKIAIEGLEFTQATQFYKSECHFDAATTEHDIGVPLVSGKPLAVRVYPDVNRGKAGNGDLPVDGELWFRPTDSLQWLRAWRFHGRVMGQSATAINRGDASHTLNFYIPEQYVNDALVIRTRVWIQMRQSHRHFSDWCERELSFVETHPLRLRLYGVQYRGNRLDLAPPTVAEALQTLDYVRKTYPISQIDVLSYDTIDFAGNFRDRPDGQIGRGWSELLLLLSRLRTASVSAVPHYALLPKGIPTDGFNGFGSGLGVGASFVGDGSAMAQELGHIFYRRHAPGCGTLDIDPRYPAYVNLPSGSIGEYGFDPCTGEVYSPTSCHDFMGYCGNYWVSPYTYKALLEVFTKKSLNDVTTQNERNELHNGRYLHLGFSLRDNHRLELESGVTLPGQPVEDYGDETSYRLELRDDEEKDLCSHSVRLRGGPVDSDEELYFLESIPYYDQARRLVFFCCQRHDPVEFEIPRRQLWVELLANSAATPGAIWDGTVDLSWKVTCVDPDRLAFYLRYTSDGGETWQPVNIGFAWRTCRVNLEQLPGGDDCRFQIIASTILQTASAESVSFRVRRKRRQAIIAGSNGTRRLEVGRPLELTGTAHSPDGFAKEGELTWRSSCQGYLGSGTYLTVHDVVPGEHEITLTAHDGMGGETEDKIVVNVIAPKDLADSYKVTQ